MPKEKLTNVIKKTVLDILDSESKLIEQGKLKKKYEAKHIRKKVADKLEFFEDKGPSLRTYQDYLKEIRESKNIIESDPEEKMWSLSTLIEYELPVETIPVVQLIQRVQNIRGKTPLNVREAKWISRLSGFFNKINNLRPEEIYNLALLGRSYAVMERDSKILGTVFDTYEFDNNTFFKNDGELIKNIIQIFEGNTITSSITAADHYDSLLENE